MSYCTYKKMDETIILDNGSYKLKAGFAGDNSPRCVFRTLTGRPKSNSPQTSTDNKKSCYIGNEAQTRREMLCIQSPIEHGIIYNWEDMEKIWNHAIYNDLKVRPEEHPFLLTEAPLNPKANREMMAEIMFENFNVPAFQVAIQSVLAMYADGRVTSLVMHSGGGVTHTLPIYEGCPQLHAIQRLDLAGRDVTRYLQRLLNERGYSFVTPSDEDIVRSIKEQLCYSAFDFESEMKAVAATTKADSSKHPLPVSTSTKETFYELPDGQRITLGDEKFRCVEMLFNPFLFTGNNYLQGVHKMLYDSIMNVDIDIRKSLCADILLSGSTTLFRGFRERLHKELLTIAPPRSKVRIRAPPERNKSAWLGGSILASLSGFEKMLISKEEYHEMGPFVVHRKRS